MIEYARISEKAGIYFHIHPCIFSQGVLKPIPAVIGLRQENTHGQVASPSQYFYIIICENIIHITKQGSSKIITDTNIQER